MKRPHHHRRPSFTALSLFAITLSSPPHHHLTTSAASLRATQEDGPAVVVDVVDNDKTSSGTISGDNSSSGDNPFPPPVTVPQKKNQKKKQKKKALLTVKLSSSSHPRSSSSSSPGEEDAPEIPLIGIGVGNLPHNKIPYLLASALSSPPSSAKNRKNSMDEELNDYRLIDTSHTDSALEVLVGRSLSRLSSLGGGGNDNDNKNSIATVETNSSNNNNNNNNVYHVMIKIWHTHLGYERTILSIQDSLSDILPGLSSAKGKTKKKKPVSAPASRTAATTTTTPDVRIHAILQYPRCYDTLFSSPTYLHSHNFSTKYSNCQQEEDSLDHATKTAGPSPLTDKENAWKRSYRALEELYHHGTLESIGVSNFGPEDLHQLFEMATVGPHVYQGSLHTLLTQEEMVEMLVKHGVHYQCYDAASAVMAMAGNTSKDDDDTEGGGAKTPRAYAKLERIGAKHGTIDVSSDNHDHVYGYSPVQVVLGWLVHHKGVGVVPGTTNAAHLAENSPRSLGGMPKFSPREALDIENAVLALVNGGDIEEEGGGFLLAKVSEEEVIDVNGYSYRHGGRIIDSSGSNNDNLSTFNGEDGGGGGVVATFFNTLPRKSIRIFHVHPDSGEQMQISHSIPSGRSGRMIVNREDVLIAYDGHGVAVKKFLVEELNNNGSVDFSVEF